jgi:HEPN domain-containing protein
MNRKDFQRLTDTRLREAKVLFSAGEYSGAYYLAGYSIECALKACFAKTVRRFDFPDKSRTSKVFTHKLTDLVELANLKEELLAATKANPRLKSGWGEVCKWSEEKRYSLSTQAEAEAILDAITRRKDGVLPWIKQRW